MTCLVLKAHKSGRSNRGSNNCYKNSRTHGLTHDGRTCPIADGCIKLPSKNDIMTRREFEDQLVGGTGYVVYRIEHFPIAQIFQQECIFSVDGNTVNVHLTFRGTDGTCQYMSQIFWEYSCDTRATMTATDVQYTGVQELQNPMYYFMSDNPSEYYILFTCTQRSTMNHGYCEGWYYVDIVLTRDPPNNPPYGQIEEELCRKLGLRLDNPLNNFLHRGEACPPQ